MRLLAIGISEPLRRPCGSLKLEELGDGPSHRQPSGIHGASVPAMPKAALHSTSSGQALRLPHGCQDVFTHTLRRQAIEGCRRVLAKCSTRLCHSDRSKAERRACPERSRTEIRPRMRCMPGPWPDVSASLNMTNARSRLSVVRFPSRSTRPGARPRVAAILAARTEAVPPSRTPSPSPPPANPTAPQQSSHHQKPSRIAQGVPGIPIHRYLLSNSRQSQFSICT